MSCEYDIQNFKHFTLVNIVFIGMFGLQVLEIISTVCVGMSCLVATQNALYFDREMCTLMIGWVGINGWLVFK